MADDIQLPSRPDNKRKHEEDRGGSPATSSARRTTGFSASPASDSHAAAAAPPPSYNSVAPPLDGFQLAKQRAQEIAARLLSDAEAKRPRVENGGSGEDAGAKGFGSSTDVPSHVHKPLGQLMANAQVNLSTPSSFLTYGYSGTNKKIEIPNGKVGVIIGKGGETIKYIQLQSGAKIQVTRDADADPYSQTRNVELMGTMEQINRAEQLINDVLQEAEVGGSGVPAAQKLVGDQAGLEQLIIKVPNHKVGLLIGKGGETIKNMQAQSGARIQIIPLHLPPGDTSTERNVHIDGTKEQIESARQLVSEIISKENHVRNPSVGGRYPQQSNRPPLAPTSWGPGPPPMQQSGYAYTQPGAYPGPNPQYMSQPPYAGYPPPPASVGYSGGWDHTSNTAGQQTASGSGYEYYNQQQPPPVAASSASDGSTYNYGQTQSSAYSTQGLYNDSAYSQPPVTQSQGYSQEGYPGSFHPPGDQTGHTHPQSNVQHVYDQQQNYGSAPAYGGTSQGGSTAAYGAQSGPVQVPLMQLSPAIQAPVNQQGYPSQQSSSTLMNYSQSNGQLGYETSQTSQPGYASQPPEAGYGQTAPSQPSYVQPPQDQTPLVQPFYGQGQQPANTQAGYVQPVPVQPGYTQPPSAQSVYAQQDSAHHLGPPSGFGSAHPLPGYAQQQSHGGVPPQSQTEYGKQQQQPSSYGGGSAGTHSQIPAHSTEGEAGGSMNGSYDASAAQSAPITKTSPER